MVCDVSEYDLSYTTRTPYPLLSFDRIFIRWMKSPSIEAQLKSFVLRLKFAFVDFKYKKRTPEIYPFVDYSEAVLSDSHISLSLKLFLANSTMLLTWNPIYSGVRLGFWIVLWNAVHIDAFIHRNSRGRGWRLHRGILAFLTSELFFQITHLAVSIEDESESSWEMSNSPLFKLQVFVDYLAQTIFLLLLLLIASGYCILRDTLGDAKYRVIGMPLIYGVTSMVFDFILLSSDNDQMVTQQVNTSDDEEEEIDSESLKALILVLCLVIKAVVFVCAWVIIFESLKKEIKVLNGEFEEQEAIVTIEEPEDNDDYTRPGLQDVVDSMENRTPDEPKTVADAVGDQAKLLLLTRFKTALIIYVMSFIAANILPLYLTNKSVQTIQSIIVVIENILLFLFLSALAIIFRPVGDNPYLLLVDDFEEVGGKEVTTELGVLRNDSPSAQETIPTQETTHVIVETGRFSLGGDEDMNVVQLQRQVSGGSTPMANLAKPSSPSWSNESPTQE